jgi:hypothetical protein
MLVGTTIEPDTTAEPEAPLSTVPELTILGIDINVLKQPSVFAPVVLSLAAFVLVLGSSIFLGMGHAADGSSADNIYRVLLASQLPVVIFRVVRRVQTYPSETLGILAIQGAAAFLAFAVHFILT